ncbi:hypothetical protein M413DRAFT_434331 [Hebeloma cylindrosporum]|uniref:Uncharacterized protein n=1 Tax=Hebeloma cylindrosporum TaxID=76867 RepID=A0A0C2YRC8_HEBCY|nr:hypothetical protein M413DRAFT_434331 [Hebeloma cylindrosporum h7]
MATSAQPIQVHKTRAKHGDDWNYGDLYFYGFNIGYQTADAFFKHNAIVVPAAPLPSTFDADFFAALNAEDAKILGGETYRMIQYLDEAMVLSPGDDSATSDFVVALLRALDFAPQGTMIRTGKNFPLQVCGEKRYAKADVCIVEGTNPLLLVQQDKSHVNPLGGDADARLVAAAIAALDKDSLYRAEYGLPKRSSSQVVGFVMSGSWPTFFKLSPRSVREDPDHPCITASYGTFTNVFAYRPVVPRPQQRLKEGMKSLDNRKLLVTEFLRLKQLMFQTSGKMVPPAGTGSIIQYEDGRA